MLSPVVSAPTPVSDRPEEFETVPVNETLALPNWVTASKTLMVTAPSP
jgi:hypothetical protein